MSCFGGTRLLNCQSQAIKLSESLLPPFPLRFVLFLTSLLQVSRICLSRTLALWVAGNSSLYNTSNEKR